MKRATLVSYSSSEADEDEDEEKKPALKKRRFDYAHIIPRGED